MPPSGQSTRKLGQYAARSLVEVAAMPGQHEDQTLLLADIGRKALRQVQTTVEGLLAKRMDPTRAKEVARFFHLAYGRMTIRSWPLSSSSLDCP